MAMDMKGMEVASKMKEELIERVAVLKERDVFPKLAIVRVGNSPDDLSYEKGAKKRMEIVGISYRVEALPEDVSQKELEDVIVSLNQEEAVHGILLLRPLPKGLDEDRIKNLIDPKKDVDCMSPINLSKVFEGKDTANTPCTPAAVMKMLSCYGIDVAGKNVVVIGRSMVVGKPLSMLLLKEHATVTICHTRTRNLSELCQKADILVAAAGKARMVKEDMVKEGAVVVDVGIHVDEAGKLCGDVDYDNVKEKASYISPVPGGVGSITTSILAEHVVCAAEELQ